LCPRLLDHYIR